MNLFEKQTLKNVSEITRIDRTVAKYFPGWGSNRINKRMELKRADAMAAVFSGLKSQRGLKDISGTWRGEDYDISSMDRLKMIATSYMLFHENPIFTGLIDRIVHNLLGTAGIWPVSMTGNEQYDDAADQIWLEWCLNCDQTGRFDYVDLQYLSTRATLTDGDILKMFTYRKSSPLPRLQLIDSARVATPYNLSKYENKQIFHGVQVSQSTAEPTFFHVGSRDNMWKMDDFRTIRATNAVHMFIPKYASSYRGYTGFLPCFNTLRYLDDVMQYALVQQKMAAVFGLIVKTGAGKKDPLGTKLSNIGNTQTAEEISHLKKLYPGMVASIKKDEELETVENKNPGDNFDNFMNLGLRMVGAGSGVPHNYIMLDFTKANYYGQRIAADQMSRGMAGIYRAEISATKKVRARVLGDAIRAGMLKLPSDGSLDRPEKYTEAVYTEPEFIAVDPEKETDTMVKKINNNLGTIGDYLLRRNKNVRKHIQRRSKEVEELIKADLPVASGGSGERTWQEVQASIELKEAQAKGK